MLSRAKHLLRYWLVPIIYRYPPTGLQPERLAVFLRGLIDRCDLPGDVAEIGCHLGGTSVLAFKAVSRAPGPDKEWNHRYICYDTFNGFIEEQFEADVLRGMAKNRRDIFSGNSDKLVRRILDYHGCAAVQLVKGDITEIPDSDLSKSYSVVLLDVDLADPTYLALKRVYPRLVEGGVIYVDDCPENYGWKARDGYQRFVREAGLPEVYEHGLGVIRK